LTESRGKQGD